MFGMTTHDWHVVAATLAIALYTGLALAGIWAGVWAAVRRWRRQRAERLIKQLFPDAQTPLEQGLAFVNAVCEPHGVHITTEPPPPHRVRADVDKPT